MELIRQLGDNDFTKRQAADQELRSLGAWVLWPLRQLDPHELDAEQLFSIRRIIESLSAPNVELNGLEDHGAEGLLMIPQFTNTARQVSMRLVGDPATWLSLLERPEASIRRTAARQLAAMLGEPIAVDPAPILKHKRASESNCGRNSSRQNARRRCP